MKKLLHSKLKNTLCKITPVAYKEQPSVKHIANEFLAESFNYDKQRIRTPARQERH